MSDADKTVEFTLKLTDEVSGAAGEAGASLVSLQERMAQDTRALSEMQRAMRRLKGSSQVSKEAVKALRDQITAKKLAVSQAQEKMLELGQTFDNVPQRASAAADGIQQLKDSIEGLKGPLDNIAGGVNRTNGMLGEASESFGELMNQSKLLPGPLGSIAGQLGKVHKALAGGAIAVGIMAIVAAVAALVVVLGAAVAALGSAVVALARFGIASSNARRSEFLRLEALRRVAVAQGQASEGAAEMQMAIDRVSESSALSRSELSGYMTRLHELGLRGQNLTDALEAMAIVGATQGDAAAQSFAESASEAVAAGRSVRALSNDIKTRFGGLAARRMLELGVLSQKLSEHFAEITDSLRIEGLLAGLRSFVRLFSQATASGRALRSMYETLFQPIIDGLAAAMPFAVAFFEGMVIGALELVLDLAELRNAFLRTFGDSDILDGMISIESATRAGIEVMRGLVAVVATLASVMAVAAGAIALVTGVLSLPLTAPIAAWAAIKAAAKAFVDWWQSVDWAGLGRSLVDGIVGGIRSGMASLTSAITGVATTAREALANALQIRSPSRVFAELGVEIPRGLAQGIDAGAPIAAASIEDLGTIPSVGGGSGGATYISIEGGIHVSGAEGEARDVAASIRDELVRILEGVSVQMGAA